MSTAADVARAGTIGARLIVACTGWGQEADRVRSRDAGFDEHLVKPIEPGGVLRLLQSLAAAPPAQPA